MFPFIFISWAFKDLYEVIEMAAPADTVALSSLRRESTSSRTVLIRVRVGFRPLRDGANDQKLHPVTVKVSSRKSSCKQVADAVLN